MSAERPGEGRQHSKGTAKVITELACPIGIEKRVLIIHRVWCSMEVLTPVDHVVVDHGIADYHFPA